MKKTALSISFIVILALVLGACGVDGRPNATAEDINAMYTQAVQTIMVQLTADAATAIATPNSTGAQPTQTMVLPPAETATTQPQPPTLQPTATVQPTETPTPTPTTPPATPTLSSEDIVKTLGGPTWRDEFDNEKYWRFSDYFKDTDAIQMSVNNGQAVLKAVKADYNYQWLLTWPNPEDFYVEITATTGATCSGGDKYGLIFRAPDTTKGYLVAFSCEGKYRLWYYDGSKEISILDWKVSDKIKPGRNQTNRLGIKAVGDQLTIYANGVAIAQTTDKTQSKGQFGLMVGSVETPNFTVYVDKLEFWDFTK